MVCRKLSPNYLLTVLIFIHIPKTKLWEKDNNVSELVVTGYLHITPKSVILLAKLLVHMDGVVIVFICFKINL